MLAHSNVTLLLLVFAILIMCGDKSIAVIAKPPAIVERKYEFENEQIVRTVVPTADFLRQRLTLEYHIDASVGVGQRESKQFSIVHHLVLFTPLEIEYALRQVGFKKIRINTALPEMAPATASDRMLAFTSEK